jgi:hypothetical protein
MATNPVRTLRATEHGHSMMTNFLPREIVRVLHERMEPIRHIGADPNNEPPS